MSPRKQVVRVVNFHLEVTTYGSTRGCAAQRWPKGSGSGSIRYRPCYGVTSENTTPCKESSPPHGSFRRELESHRHLLGEEHPDTLTAMAGLARTLYRQGDWAGARKLQSRY